jgi:hypothetical protein
VRLRFGTSRIKIPNTPDPKPPPSHDIRLSAGETAAPDVAAVELIFIMTVAAVAELMVTDAGTTLHVGR